MSEFVSVKNLTKNYGEFCAVDNLSFSVNEGEIFGLLGPNGAGKSTTLSIITTLLDFDKGSVSIDGLDINKDRMKVKKNIGMVPQEIALYNHLNAYENVCFFASLYGLSGQKLKSAALKALEFVGLSDKAKLKPKQMSGGMQRRLNIACGIAHSPKFIVMDEPTVGVDAQSRDHIMNTIKILRDNGATIAYTSHYMKEVEEICDRIAIIDHGKLIASGTEQELVSLVTDIKSYKIESRIKSDFKKDDFISKMSKLPGVTAVSIDNDTIRFDVKYDSEPLPIILENMKQSGLKAVSINSDIPNLETIFLTLTGHELRK